MLGLAGFAGCSTLGYYLQAFNGQMELTRKARPIPQVLDDEHTPAELKDASASTCRRSATFASRELKLPDNGSYRRYADLQRPYVVWNVFATPEFSVVPQQWCFPIAGCVGYRGYFAPGRGRRVRGARAQGGLDVYVGGVPAYSTLGWFDDPVLNTFVRYPDTELARLVFHELAHQVVYAARRQHVQRILRDDRRAGGREALVGRARHPGAAGRIRGGQVRRRDFAELVTRYRDKLERAVRQRHRRAGDAQRQSPDLRGRCAPTIRALREQWGGFAGYDWWFDQPLNNAQIASVAMYTQLVPGFQKLLAESGGDLPRFYQAVRRWPKNRRRNGSRCWKVPVIGDIESGDP